MTLTATYADDLGRVRLSISAPPDGADYAIIERSLDQITWQTVRGGDLVPLSGGVSRLDDYEFTPGAVNYYRASYREGGPPVFLGAGAAVSGDNAPLTPPLPSGSTPYCMLFLIASIADENATVTTPPGWFLAIDLGHLKVCAHVYEAGMAAPDVTFAGGAAGVATLAQIAAFHNAGGYIMYHWHWNASRQNIAVSTITAGFEHIDDGGIYLIMGAKADASTARSLELSGWDTIGSYSTDAGGGATLAWYCKVTDVQPPDTQITVTGGAPAYTDALLIHLNATADPYTHRDTTSITPTLTRVWIKNLQRPYLNRTVTVTDFSDITRQARAGVFEVIGRTSPIAVTDVRGSRRYTLTLTTATPGEAHDLDAVLLAGEPVLVQVPANAPFPGMYAVIGTTKQSRHSMRTRRRFFDLPLTEVAAPDPTIVGATVLWADIITAFATWADLIAAETSWADVLDRIASPTDIVTG